MYIHHKVSLIWKGILINETLQRAKLVSKVEITVFVVSHKSLLRFYYVKSRKINIANFVYET